MIPYAILRSIVRISSTVRLSRSVDIIFIHDERVDFVFILCLIILCPQDILLAVFFSLNERLEIAAPVDL